MNNFNKISEQLEIIDKLLEKTEKGLRVINRDLIQLKKKTVEIEVQNS